MQEKTKPERVTKNTLRKATHLANEASKGTLYGLRLDDSGKGYAVSVIRRQDGKEVKRWEELTAIMADHAINIFATVIFLLKRPVMQSDVKILEALMESEVIADNEAIALRRVLEVLK